MSAKVLTRQQRMDILRFRKEVASEVDAMLDHGCALLNESTSPIVPTSGFRSKIALSLSWSPNRRLSRGGFRNGKPFISLSLKRMTEHGPMTYVEYSSLQHSVQIGSFSGPWQVFLAGLVAHELAHAVQYTHLFKGSKAVKGHYQRFS